jgi:3-hydroxy acid dehydrogenase / malonic semialdehyde reductase
MSSRPVAVITGASRGIGRAVATRLARGCDIVAVARDAAALGSLADELRDAGAACTTLAVDLRDPEAIAGALRGVDADILVNNAGVMTSRPFLELSADDWHRMVDVNLNALFHVTRALLPGMVERGSGDVVVIGSLAGRNAFAGGSCYAATKHAVVGFAESLMLEVRQQGVRVSMVMPGSVATDLFPEGTDTTWMMRPEDVAGAVAAIIESPRELLLSRVEMRPAAPPQRS